MRLHTSEAQGEDRTLGQEVFVVEIIVRHQSAPPLHPALAGDLVESLEPPRESLPPALDASRALLTEVTNTDRPPGSHQQSVRTINKQIFSTAYNN